MAYDDANANVRREVSTGIIAGADGASMAKFLMFQKTRLKAVHAVVTTAGTDTGAGVDIFVGTSSVGAIALGTSTAGVQVSVALDAAVPAKGVIELKGKADSATLKAAFVLEHEVDPDAVVTP